MLSTNSKPRHYEIRNNTKYNGIFTIRLRTIIFTMVLLSLASYTEGIFKLGKKKKFMEGFLMGFFIGNEFGAHKANGGKGIPMEALAKHAMPFALKDTGVNPDDLTSLMMKMNGKPEGLPMKKTMMLRRVHAPKRVKVIRRIRPIMVKPAARSVTAFKTVKYPVFLRETSSKSSS